MEPEQVYVVTDGNEYLVFEDGVLATQFVEVENKKGWKRYNLPYSAKKIRSSDVLSRVLVILDGNIVSIKEDVISREAALDCPYMAEGRWKSYNGILHGAGPDLQTALKWLAVAVKENSE